MSWPKSQDYPRGVLNAFRHDNGRHNWANSQEYGTCAQRLSASQRSARRIARHAASQGVLNAFRHHRVGMILDQPVRLQNGDVLNAFRHHRVRHVLPRPFRQYRCSTPFGITEFGMTALCG